MNEIQLAASEQSRLDPDMANSTLLPNAPSQTELTQSTRQIDPVDLTSAWLGRLDVYSGIFLSVCGIILAFIGYLSWISNKQKNEAKKTLEEMRLLYSQGSEIYKNLSSIISKTEQTLDKASAKLGEVEKMSDGIIKSAKKKGADVEEIASEMEQLKTKIYNERILIDDVQGSIPLLKYNTFHLLDPSVGAYASSPLQPTLNFGAASYDKEANIFRTGIRNEAASESGISTGSAGIKIK